MDASADKRWTSLLTAADSLSRWDKPAPEQQSQRAQQASRTAAETLAEEPALFQTLEEELAALLSIDLERPGSALAQARPNTGGLPRNDGPAPTAFTSATSGAVPTGSASPPHGAIAPLSLGGGTSRASDHQPRTAVAATVGGVGLSAPPPPVSSPPPTQGSGGTVLANQTYYLSSGGNEQVAVTVTVTADEPSYPGQYLWQYQVANVDFYSPGEYDGVGVFFMFFSPDDDLANITGPAGWVGNPGTPPGDDGVRWFGSDVIEPEESGNFSFTTAPRALALVGAEAWDPAFAFASAGGLILGPGECTAPELQSVTFVPAGGVRGGDLLPNSNPNGEPGLPAFGGGDRFFPDAASYETRAQSRNVVRIQATVANAVAGVTVYFRSFDVDDPSADQTIDPNGNAGRDNRGIAAGPNVDGPFPAPPDLGYRGRLRPVGGSFANEGAVVSATTNTQGKAEVELATSFNPGDNFRVVASCNQQEVQNLNDTNSIPTRHTDPIANFTGKATPQLSVWRRLHIEQDRMAAIPWGTVSGNITAVGAPNPEGEVVITTNLNLAANQFRGGSLRAANTASDPHVPGLRYLILRHTTGANSTVTVRQTPDLFAPAPGPVTLTQGDFQAGTITAAEVRAGGTVALTTDLNITDPGEYNDGILRTNGTNYHIVAGTAGPDSLVTILANAAPPLGAVTVYQDDFSSNGDRLGNFQQGTILLAEAPAGGQVRVQTNMNIATANRFAGGTLVHVEGGAVYPIVSNTAGPNAIVTITAATTPTFPSGVVLYTSLGAAVPTALANVASDANLYDMLQPTILRAQNRFADAYIQPERNALNQFDSNNVTPVSHASSFNSIIREIADPFRGTSPGSAPRPDNYETNVFWSVYIVTAFEPFFSLDGDPESEGFLWGITDGALGQISMIYLETIRDLLAQYPSVPSSEAEARARAVVHEIGHQFDIAVGIPSEHRDDVPNIMHSEAMTLPNVQFFFHAIDIVALRERIISPGL